LCVYDDVVRRLEPEQVHALGELARQVVQWLELRRRTRELQDAIGELERSNAELSSFAARVAHDLRNPLAAVLGFLQLLQRHFATELSDAGQEVVTAALKAADGMRSLVDDLLSYAAAGVTPELVDVDLDEVVAAVQLALAPALGRSGGRIVTDAPLGTVRGDRTLLRQLVQNLVANSLKFGREGVPPVVWISRGDVESGWSLIVADNGRGVPAEDHAHVFDLFARARNVGGAPGTGIGLATCARIAEVLGGVLDVADTPGGGATFTLLVR
jgi:signal transduction histidine kinase